MHKVARFFVDTEFTDFTNCDLISIGLVGPNGEKFYGENSTFVAAWASDWVKANIYPLLDYNKYGKRREELSAHLWEWLNEQPYDEIIIVADYHKDFELLQELLVEKHPKISDIENINNNIYHDIDKQVAALGGNDDDYHYQVKKVVGKFRQYFAEYFERTAEMQHHALSDACANQEAYSKIALEFGIRL